MQCNSCGLELGDSNATLDAIEKAGAIPKCGRCGKTLTQEPTPPKQGLEGVLKKHLCYECSSYKDDGQGFCVNDVLNKCNILKQAYTEIMAMVPDTFDISPWLLDVVRHFYPEFKDLTGSIDMHAVTIKRKIKQRLAGKDTNG